MQSACSWQPLCHPSQLGVTKGRRGRVLREPGPSVPPWKHWGTHIVGGRQPHRCHSIFALGCPASRGCVTARGCSAPRGLTAGRTSPGGAFLSETVVYFGHLSKGAPGNALCFYGDSVPQGRDGIRSEAFRQVRGCVLGPARGGLSPQPPRGPGGRRGRRTRSVKSRVSAGMSRGLRGAVIPHRDCVQCRVPQPSPYTRVSGAGPRSVQSARLQRCGTLTVTSPVLVRPSQSVCVSPVRSLLWLFSTSSIVLRLSRPWPFLLCSGDSDLAPFASCELLLRPSVCPETPASTFFASFGYWGHSCPSPLPPGFALNSAAQRKFRARLRKTETSLVTSVRKGFATCLRNCGKIRKGRPEAGPPGTTSNGPAHRPPGGPAASASRKGRPRPVVVSSLRHRGHTRGHGGQELSQPGGRVGSVLASPPPSCRAGPLAAASCRCLRLCTRLPSASCFLPCRRARVTPARAPLCSGP